MALTVRHCQRAWQWGNLAYLNNAKREIGLQLMRIIQAKTRIDYNGYWVHLDGIEYDDEAAHLTITPGPDKEMNWTYFHFTPVRAGAKHAFYELLDEPEQQYTEPDLYIRRSKKTCDKYKELVTRDEKKTATEDLPTSIDADVNKLIWHIVTAGAG